MIVRHALRNALLPVVTLIGSTIGIAVGGAMFIESRVQLARHGAAAGDAVERGTIR